MAKESSAYLYYVTCMATDSTVYLYYVTCMAKDSVQYVCALYMKDPWTVIV